MPDLAFVKLHQHMKLGEANAVELNMLADFDVHPQNKGEIQWKSNPSKVCDACLTLMDMPAVTSKFGDLRSRWMMPFPWILVIPMAASCAHRNLHGHP